MMYQKESGKYSKLSVHRLKQEKIMLRVSMEVISLFMEVKIIVKI
jgi:hypothetical protein